MTRVWKWRLTLGVVVIAFGASIGAYALLVEPYWIEVTHHRIAAPLDTPLNGISPAFGDFIEAGVIPNHQGDVGETLVGRGKSADELQRKNNSSAI